MRARTLVLALIALPVALAAGCGIDESRQGPPFQPGNITSPHSLLISQDDVTGIGASSPYGAILQWWRALQRGDVQGVRRSYTGHVSAREARRQIEEFQPRYSQPVVPEEDEGRRRATIDLLLRVALRLGDMPKVIGVHDFPATFELVRRGEGWKLRRTAYGAYRRALLDGLAEEE